MNMSVNIAGVEWEKPGNSCIRNIWFRRRIFRICRPEPSWSSDNERCGERTVGWKPDPACS